MQVQKCNEKNKNGQSYSHTEHRAHGRSIIIRDTSVGLNLRFIEVPRAQVNQMQNSGIGYRNRDEGRAQQPNLHLGHPSLCLRLEVA